MVHYALPLFQETEEERYLLEPPGMKRGLGFMEPLFQQLVGPGHVAYASAVLEQKVAPPPPPPPPAQHVS